MSASPTPQLDAIVIGAGFGGMYMLKRLRDDLGLRVRGIEAGDGVGGTWYWNRYPGARCDVESIYYSYGFDAELEQDWTWTERYAAQPEILAYAEHVADRFALRNDITFGCRVLAASWDEADQTWSVECDDGQTLTSRYLVSAVGCLSVAQMPALPGQDEFAGQVLHTGQWPHEGVDLRGKRVAVIGTGSSGIQLIPQIAQEAAHLTVFQRTPHYSAPARNRPLTEEEVAEVKATYPAIRATIRTTSAGTALLPAETVAAALTPAEQRALLADRWERGGPGIIGVFQDVMIDPDANEVVAAYFRRRIAEVVEDPEVAALLTPTDYPVGTKRICVDTDYFETYNRDNVTLVSVRKTPIERITANGVVVDGVEHAADVLVYATGFDAMTGPLNRIDIRGTDGRLLRDKWAEGPRTYLGLAVHGFPNLFVITGPGSPSVLTNMITSIEQHVDFIADYLRHLRDAGVAAVEPTREAEEAWVERVNAAADRTLYPRAASWYVGANVPGKPRVFMPFVGGAGAYRLICDEVAADGYRGFHAVAPSAVAAPA